MTSVLRDRYRIAAPIGEGGMGAVYLADDLRLPGRQCAVKEILPLENADEAVAAAARARLRREAAVLARLDHPGLPSVTDHFESGGRVYLVMDFVPGQDLKAVITDARSRGRALDPLQVQRWAEELCRILTYLHRQVPPVIHRDIKPANIKLTPDGQIRLVDFGLAQPAGVVPGGQTVTVVSGGGSRAYQPLEQYGDGAQTDVRSDLYALGATLYHLVTGRPPPSAQVRFLAPERLRPVLKERPEVPHHLAAAVNSALALHPDDRPATAEAMRQLIIAPAAPTSAAWSVALRRNAWLVAVVITLLLAALALTVRPP